MRYLVPVFGIVILITILVLWGGFLGKEEPIIDIERPIKKIEIDFKVLESPVFKELQPFEKIPPFEEEIGRENPFTPY